METIGKLNRIDSIGNMKGDRFKDFSETICTYLIKKAFEARENAYAPYSGYKVGAAILLNNGETIFGANVENISYGLTSCAERNALFGAYSKGVVKEDILAIAIIADDDEPVTPCGACRQVIMELLDEDTPIILANTEKYAVVGIEDLLPGGFDSEKVAKRP